MNKLLLYSLVVVAISFAIVTLTVDGVIQLGEFSLEVPDLIYDGATWLMGISASVGIPVGLKVWLSNRHNTLINAGLQDMKLTLLIQQNDIIIRQNAVDFNTTEAEREQLKADIGALADKTKALVKTFANFMEADNESKRTYFTQLIANTELMIQQAKSIGDNATVKRLTKELTNMYNSIKSVQ